VEALPGLLAFLRDLARSAGNSGGGSSNCTSLTGPILPGSLLFEAHYGGIRPGAEEILMSGITPSDQVRRLAVHVADLQHFAVPIGLTHPTATDENLVSDFRKHRDSFVALAPHVHGEPPQAIVQASIAAIPASAR
jgi:hypothetical protein